MVNAFFLVLMSLVTFYVAFQYYHSINLLPTPANQLSLELQGKFKIILDILGSIWPPPSLITRQPPEECESTSDLSRSASVLSLSESGSPVDPKCYRLPFAYQPPTYQPPTDQYGTADSTTEGYATERHPLDLIDTNYRQDSLSNTELNLHEISDAKEEFGKRASNKSTRKPSLTNRILESSVDPSVMSEVPVSLLEPAFTRRSSLKVVKNPPADVDSTNTSESKPILKKTVSKVNPTTLSERQSSTKQPLKRIQYFSQKPTVSLKAKSSKDNKGRKSDSLTPCSVCPPRSVSNRRVSSKVPFRNVSGSVSTQAKSSFHKAISSVSQKALRRHTTPNITTNSQTSIKKVRSVSTRTLSYICIYFQSVLLSLHLSDS